MILQSLYNYYQILLKDPKVIIALPGYRSENINYVLNLSNAGELLDVIPLTSGEKKYRVMRAPERAKRSGTKPKPNFLWDNSAFVLGIPEKKGKDDEYGAMRFEAFRQHNIEILSKANTEVARAVIAFLKKHNPKTALHHAAIARYADDFLESGNLAFQVEGQFAFNDPEVMRVWEEHLIERDQKAVKMQCLVTGKDSPIARTHPDVKGVRGTRQNRASLVSFNKDSFESYGRTQGFNSPVSQRVASGYGVVLDYLLSEQNPNRPIYIGDAAIIYWADSPDDRYPSAFSSIINPAYLEDEEEDEDAQKGRRKAEQQMSDVAQKIEKGQALDVKGVTEGLDKETRFYVLGLAPNALTNASRLTVRFFLAEPFGKFVKRVMQHYKDMELDREHHKQPKYISPNLVLKECIPSSIRDFKSRQEHLKSSWSLLGGALMRSILTGAPYPEGLYAAIINRIRHDTDETNDEGKRRNVKINYVRAAFIKAHLLRKYRRQDQNLYQEALQMSLNESYTHPAYVLGRLFAWLERAQKAALGQNINATIKDRYFTSACASPASVFPILLRLSHHHFEKAEYGKYLERQVEGLLAMLEAKPFPARLTLDEQGVFVLGYYHQRAFRKGDEAEEIAESKE
ncbi:MAG: type I-C CRISPR-associated protein Cas8c/Csd1 [Chloroflexi bacterium]|nr:type I-C CRISPR-associated protein Cas8c/Csd1 [Chloroflexota bacterium]